jgi:phosphohistidine swiveling domain-containing protein
VPRFSGLSADITHEEVVEILPILKKFWYFYGITEFSFHDFAYQKLQETNDQLLKKNLDDLGKLKFEGRELLNSYVFEDGVLHNLLRNVSKQFLANENGGVFLFSDEIIGLYNGQKIANQVLGEREKYYGCASFGRALNIFSNQEALNAWGDFCVSKGRQETIKGTVGYGGIASGKAIIVPMLVDMKEITRIGSKMNQGDILVAESTTPELMMLCKKAAAIVTDQGGMLSHAAIVSRELKIPCVIGTGNATRVLHNGDMIEVDANKGVVNVLEQL